MTDKQYNGIIVNYEVFYMSDSRSAKAFIASAIMDEIIMERCLINILPSSNKFYFGHAYRFTGFKYYQFKKYEYSDLFKISSRTIDITDDTQLLLKESKNHIEYLIKRTIIPTKYKYHKNLVQSKK